MRKYHQAIDGNRTLNAVPSNSLVAGFLCIMRFYKVRPGIIAKLMLFDKSLPGNHFQETYVPKRAGEFFTSHARVTQTAGN